MDYRCYLYGLNDPKIGSYINQDPIGLMGGVNSYSYPMNPLGRVDPRGLSNVPTQAGNVTDTAVDAGLTGVAPKLGGPVQTVAEGCFVGAEAYLTVMRAKQSRLNAERQATGEADREREEQEEIKTKEEAAQKRVADCKEGFNSPLRQWERSLWSEREKEEGKKKHNERCEELYWD
jgi:uncharacterized protein RhaS with RHS repeats